MTKNDRSVINAWCSYDIANSAYNLVITATIFPIYFQEVTSNAYSHGIVTIGKLSVHNTVLYDYALSAAYLCVVFLSPLLSGIADFGGYRRWFMRFFTYLGSLACLLLYFFDGKNIWFGLSMAALAVIGYAGSLVFYNSFLPIIADKEFHDRISAKGFAWGYIGSVLLLIMLLVFISYHDDLGIKESLQSVRLAFPIVGLWWFSVAHISLLALKESRPSSIFYRDIFFKGYIELLQVWKKIKKQTIIKNFLLAFFLFSAGVQTILLVATLFGKAEIGLSGNQLIITIILIQFLGLAGALLFAEVSVRMGNKFSLLAMISIWFFVCVMAWLIKGPIQFYILAGIVGLIMGGIQSQARSTYAKLISTEKDTALYFSFYEVTEKTAIVMGMLIFGIMQHYSGNMRLSALILAVFFVFSWFVLYSTTLPNRS